MANYVALARTNYFRVKDLDAFKSALRVYGIEPHSWDDRVCGAEFVLDDARTNRPTGAIALFSFGSWPSLDEDSVADRLELDDDEEVPSQHADICSLVADHLLNDYEVAVFMEVGFEKLRYLVGTTIAVNSCDERRSVDMSDIYALSEELLPDDGTPAAVTRAEH